MNTRVKYRLIKATTLLLFFFSCSEEKKTEIIIKEVPPTAEILQPSPPPLPTGLAVLKKLTNRADMRTHDESVWQTAVTGTNFFRHDALQTHEAANAHVKYESGSTLELKEKTLIIFDKDPGITDHSVDRILLKNGKLVGATKKELWVFTNAGLVQIKTHKKNQPAQATLSINQQKKLKVVVNSGSADLIIKKNEKEFQKFSLAEKSEFEFKAVVDFNIASEKKIELNNLDLIAKAATDIKSNTLAELVIEAPLDNSVSIEEKFDVEGRLTEIGAKLLINGELVEIADDLTFKKTITLTGGTNLVVFQLVRSDASVKFYRKNIRLSRNK